MDKYTIYCTPEQTKKAIKLCAPILGLKSTTKEDITTIQCVKLDTPIHTDVIEGGFDYAIIPTSEQMISWLEEQNVYINICWDDSIYFVKIRSVDKGYLGIGDKLFSTRKEATLVAIDEALKHLEENDTRVQGYGEIKIVKNPNPNK